MHRRTIVMLIGANWQVSGGGWRPVGIALSWLRMGYRIVYVEAWDSIERQATIPPPQGVTIVKASQMHALPKDTALLYVSFPMPQYIRLAHMARKLHIPVHYDIYDHWRCMYEEGYMTVYHPDCEEELFRIATSFSCVSHNLKTYLEKAKNVSIAVIPNAADPQRWRDAAAAPKGAIAIYIGTLGKQWEWVSHDAIVAAAEANPSWTFQIVGGYLKRRALPSNVICHGMVAEEGIGKRVAGGRVGLVPFKPCATAYYCDPIKAWEYLACGMVIAAANAPSLKEMPNVAHEEGDEIAAFLKAFERAKTLPFSLPFGFWERNSWYARARAILETALHIPSNFAV